MPSLHEQWRKVALVRASEVVREMSGLGKHPGNGLIQLPDDVELFHMTFTELGVAHNLSDDAVGALNLLLNHLNLFQRIALGFTNGPMKRKSGGVDDRQRVFDLMRKLGGEPARPAKVAFPQGEIARLL